MNSKYSTSGSPVFQTALHVVVWMAFLAFPILLSPNDEPDWKSIILRHILPLTFSAILFYSNYFYLIKKFLFESRIGIFLITNIILILLFIFMFEGLRDLIFKSEFRHDPHKPLKIFFYFRVFISYMLPIGISVAIRSTQRYLESQLHQKNRENEMLRSELQYLHYQIQPHFFFNSLNTVYSLISSDPGRAQKALHQLSKLMRYVLYDASEEKVRIEKEIEFLENYIHVMKERQGHLFHVKAEFNIHETGILIAPLLFIPLVENAFKHSMPSNGMAEINISLQQENGYLFFKVVNSLHPAESSDKSGIGLENLRKRLDVLYPGKYELQINIDREYFIAHLKIQV